MSSQLLAVDEAIKRLQALLPAPPASHPIALDQAAGRVLAKTVFAPAPLPSWDNSAMDGYALRASDLGEDGGTLTLAGRISAGHASTETLQPGHCLRIFTGAPMPPGADTVVPQESCQAEQNQVTFPACKLGANVRLAGEELMVGDQAIAAGTRLGPQHLGLLASLGVGSVTVYRPLRVGLLSTGDELVELDQTRLPGQIYNSNHYALTALLQGWGIEVIDLGHIADSLADCKTALSQGAEQCDVLLSSGGVSVGEEDHLKHAVAALGSLDLWRLAIQPGKPFAFGYVQQTPWLGLPGNPVSALITALIVARPYLLGAQGRQVQPPLQLSLSANFNWQKNNPRRQYLRAQVQQQGHELVVSPHPQQSSAMLAPACWANGLAIIEPNQRIQRGQPVGFVSFSELMT
ncbi:MAG: gephyrin-like molybdotransferase Glp [Moraxellaceae bacterium]|nr:gephyrin-like molybdotransferase Glp [Moraxellaceae bacterium]MDZ4386248.1 gephyrin-like molybdotransferase Glp [Moraxellaceae bacterium]